MYTYSFEKLDVWQLSRELVKEVYIVQRGFQILRGMDCPVKFAGLWFQLALILRKVLLEKQQKTKRSLQQLLLEV